MFFLYKRHFDSKTILKELYRGLQHCRKKDEVKQQNIVQSQNPYFLSDSIGLINY